MLYRHLLRPLAFRLSEDPETAHELALSLFADLGRHPVTCGYIRRITASHDDKLGKTVCGIHFPNPIGLAAGFVKHPGDALHGLAALGFGFIELGTITPEKQEGNPRPRMFRLPKDEALINRMGFNNAGAVESLKTLQQIGQCSIPLGISIGKGKDTPIEEAEKDYLSVFDLLNAEADYIAVNVSSPNTKDLRKLQDKPGLSRILKALRERAVWREQHHQEKILPLFVKFTCDLTNEALDEGLDVCVSHGVDGIITTNTTTGREGLKTRINEVGGLSGKPLRGRAPDMVRYIRNRLPNVAIMGVGGISTLDDVKRMQNAGADLCQIYTGFIYEGPRLPMKLNAELARGL